MNHTTHPTLILGGGFTGLFTALHLSHRQYALPTILVDREWRFLFKPLLYEFLSGEMNLDLICPRYDSLLHRSSVGFVRDTVQAIDLQQRQVHLGSGLHYSYSYLVLALGSVSGYSSIKGAAENTFPFRSIEDAIALGQHLRDCLQRASQTTDPMQRRTLLTVVILGAGASGVELATTLADLLPDWYAPLGGNISELRVLLIQRGTEILKGAANNLRQTGHQALQTRTIPVELLLETKVTAIQAQAVEYQHHNQTKVLPAATVIWTTGNSTHPLVEALPIADAYRSKRGQLQVTPTLQLPDFPDVFAGGDCAVDLEHPLPMTAQVAYQQGAMIAHNLKALSEGRSLDPARVHLRGTLMKLGLDESAAEIFDRFEVKGTLGHLIRQAAYLELLPTPIRNFKATTEWLSDEVFRRIAHV